MTPKKFRKEVAVNSRGWSRWVAPKPDKYLMQCCDCLLVHEMQFRVVIHPSQKKIQIQFRCRRDNKSTTQQRKKKITSSKTP